MGGKGDLQCVYCLALLCSFCCLSSLYLSLSVCLYVCKELEGKRQEGELDSLRRTVLQREEELGTMKERFEETKAKLQESQETVQKNERSEPVLLAHQAALEVYDTVQCQTVLLLHAFFVWEQHFEQRSELVMVTSYKCGIAVFNGRFFFLC